MSALQAEDPTGLLFEERVERAERLRLEGNELYKSGDHKMAESKYVAVGADGCVRRAEAAAAYGSTRLWWYDALSSS